MRATGPAPTGRSPTGLSPTGRTPTERPPVDRAPQHRLSVVLAAALGVLSIVIVELRVAGRLPEDVDAVLGYTIFAGNLVLAVAGLRTPYRPWWLGYLVASLLFMLLIGAATPIDGLWLLSYLLWQR